MKPFMILGSVVGFLIGVGFSLNAGCPWPTALWRAAAVALVVTILTRWWSYIWLQGLQETFEQKRHANQTPSVNTKPTAKI